MNARILPMLLLVAVAGMPASARQQTPAPAPGNSPDETSRVPPLPSTPAAVTRLMYARPFTLQHGYEFEWRSERTLVRAGWLLVLEVNPSLVFPRQTAEPILYVGDTTAERVNIGHESGRIVVIVPSNRTDAGEIALDLHKALMWFGAPGLPEQVDAAKVQHETALAKARNIQPFQSQSVASAIQNGGQMLSVDTREALRHAAAELILTHSPQEAELAQAIMQEQAASPKGQ